MTYRDVEVNSTHPVGGNGWPGGDVGAYYHKRQYGGNDRNAKTPQPYSMALRTWHNSPIRWDVPDWVYSSGQGFHASTVFTLFPMHHEGPIDITKQQYQLLNELSEYAKGHKLNLAISLGELPETVAMIGKTATRVAGFFNALRKGNVWKARRYFGLNPIGPNRVGERFTPAGLLDFASSSWLEAKLGWQPLFDDVYNAAEAAAVHLNRENKVLRHKVTRKIVKHLTQNIHRNGCIYLITRKRVWRVSLTLADNGGLSVPQALGLTDWRSLGWELTPLSFVWDWFQPVGDALSAAYFIENVSGDWVVSDLSVEKGTIIDMNPDSVPYWVPHHAPNAYTDVSMSRYLNAPALPPLPSPQFPLKGLAGKATTAAALVTQALSNIGFKRR